MTIQHHLQHQFTVLFSDLMDVTALEACPPVVVQACRDSQHGDYQCNAAMPWAKMLRQAPRAIAERVVEAWYAREELTALADLEIAGPGFINVRLREGALLNWHQAQALDDHFGARVSEVERVIVDYSSPNVAKEMHVGHLRSTIIGDCLANVLAFQGHDVLRLNHIGDWGTAFGMLIHYIRSQELEEAINQEVDIAELVVWYRDSKRFFDEDETFKRASQMAVVALQQGEPWARAIWQRLYEISRRSYEAIYAVLGIEGLQERGESFYQPFLDAVIEDLRAADLLTESDGAQCVFLPGFKNRDGEPLPLMVQKSDGGFNYASTDLAAVKYRMRTDKADRAYYVTDLGQATHFAQVFAAAEAVGYVDDAKRRLHHVPFGLVLGADGKKFKTRSGETEKLSDLLAAAVKRARGLMEERHADWPAEELDRSAEVMGVGAVKYADLSCQRVQDYRFSYDKMLSFEGNTVVAMLYARVRIASILRQAAEQGLKVDVTTLHSVAEPAERQLLLHCLRFAEVIEEVAEQALPNRLCDYLYQLANLFNQFFRDCPVLKADQPESRLALCQQVDRVMCTGLGLLGIRTLDRM